MKRIINPCQYLERAACSYPGRTAVRDGKGRSYTYGELLDMVSSVGRAISQRTSGNRQPVLVLCDRNIESLVLLLGTVWAGDFYAPIDRSLPQQRVDGIARTLGEPLRLQADEETVHSLYNEGKNLAGEPWNHSLNQDLLYVIFTSGSTGVPKGVAIRIGSVLDMVDDFSETFDIPTPLVTANQAPFDFDVSVKDIYLTLAHAGTLVIVPKVLFSMPGGLVPYLRSQQVTMLVWAVSALRIVENFDLLRNLALDSIRLVMFSGETMSPKVMRYWQSHLPHTVFVNLYGPTEITCNCTYFVLDRQFQDDEQIPMGRAFRNCAVELCDEQGHYTREQGEICVRGACVAAGYYGALEKTREAFQQDKNQSAYSEVVYHTGDLGRYDADGRLIFCGRRDNQIKHMGHRIELGELEAAAMRLSEVRICCAIYERERQHIVLFYEAEADLQKRIEEALRSLLPRYMWPNSYKWLDRIPQTTHGKCDRVRLQKMARDEERNIHG